MFYPFVFTSKSCSARTFFIFFRLHYLIFQEREGAFPRTVWKSRIAFAKLTQARGAL